MCTEISIRQQQQQQKRIIKRNLIKSAFSFRRGWTMFKRVKGRIIAHCDNVDQLTAGVKASFITIFPSLLGGDTLP